VNELRFLAAFFGERGVLCVDSTKAKLVAQLKYALTLDIHHPACAAINSS